MVGTAHRLRDGRRIDAGPFARAHDLIDEALDRAVEASDEALAEALERVADAVQADFADEERELRRSGFPLWDEHAVDHSVGIGIISDAIIAAREGDRPSARRGAFLRFADWNDAHRSRHDAALAAWVALAAHRSGPSVDDRFADAAD